MGFLRTILRRGFYSDAAVSGLLLLATLILWPLSLYRRVSATHVDVSGTVYFLVVEPGRAAGGHSVADDYGLGWGFGVSSTYRSHWSYLTWNTPDPDLDPSTRTFLGVCWLHEAMGAGRTHDFVWIPFSYLALLFSLLPLLAFRSIRRQRKAARIGLCPKCNYDLRAQHAGRGGAVCPECGAPLAVKGW